MLILFQVLWNMQSIFILWHTYNSDFPLAVSLSNYILYMYVYWHASSSLHLSWSIIFYSLYLSIPTTYPLLCLILFLYVYTALYLCPSTFVLVKLSYCFQSLREHKSVKFLSGIACVLYSKYAGSWKLVFELLLNKLNEKILFENKFLRHEGPILD